MTQNSWYVEHIKDGVIITGVTLGDCMVVLRERTGEFISYKKVEPGHYVVDDGRYWIKLGRPNKE